MNQRDQQNIFHVTCKVDGRKYNSDQRWKVNICQGEYKELMRYCVCKED